MTLHLITNSIILTEISFVIALTCSYTFDIHWGYQNQSSQACIGRITHLRLQVCMYIDQFHGHKIQFHPYYIHILKKCVLKSVGGNSNKEKY